MTTDQTDIALPTLADIEAIARRGVRGASEAGESTPALTAASGYSFDSWLWKSYRELAGVGWDLAGSFAGQASFIYKGPGRYLYNPSPASEPFSFTRASGEVITPGRLLTDGGTIPRIAWMIPEVNPWAYFPAYLLHDWVCAKHHCNPETPPRSFADVNSILAEGIYTLMVTGTVAADWRKAALIYTAVQGTYGRKYWDLAWSRAECDLWLPTDNT